jgi:hypothetical protein
MPISQILLASNTSGGGGGGSYTGPGPDPGTGDYLTSWAGSADWSAQGSAYNPGGGVASIDNASAGWIRKIYTGQWSISGINGNDNPGIFNGAENHNTVDVYGSFGSTTIGDYYCMEWKGYIQVSNSGTGVYNLLVDSDDVAMFWIGTAALDPNFDNKLLWSNNGNHLNPNSVILSNGLYYPIRMRLQEWAGAERCQLFMGLVGSGVPLNSMSGWTMRHNGNTGGY